MKFEQSRPEHEVHEIHRPHGHGMLDQKHQKGMRSPITGSVPVAGQGTVPGEMGVGSPGQAPLADNTGESSQGMGY